MKGFLASVVLFVAMTAQAVAWGHAGHLLISEAGARDFPPSLPAFVRTASAIAEIRELGPEADNVKNAGSPFDDDQDPAHYIDLSDDGTAAGVSMMALPMDREAFDSALRRAGTTQYGTGFLPYSLIDGWEHVVADFAYWRVDVVAERRATSNSDRTFFSTQRRLREALTIRDIGYWSHFVGDASQPLHTSVHFDGWDRYPNSKGIHERFESPYVRSHATLPAVLRAFPQYRSCRCTIRQYVARYLGATNAQVVPLYELGTTTDSFRNATPQATAFVTARLAAGAGALRDLVVMAWEASADGTVGYPSVNVRDVVSGKVKLTKDWLNKD